MKTTDGDMHMGRALPLVKFLRAGEVACCDDDDWAISTIFAFGIEEPPSDYELYLIAPNWLENRIKLFPLAYSYQAWQRREKNGKVDPMFIGPFALQFTRGQTLAFDVTPSLPDCRFEIHGIRQYWLSP